MYARGGTASTFSTETHACLINHNNSDPLEKDDKIWRNIDRSFSRLAIRFHPTHGQKHSFACKDRYALPKTAHRANSGTNSKFINRIRYMCRFKASRRKIVILEKLRSYQQQLRSEKKAFSF